MGVYSFGSNPQAWARPIASGISTYRAKKAAEEEAARKAAEKAQKAAAAAQKKATKAKERADKIAQKADEERLKEYGPNTDQEIADLGYSSPGHFRTSADRWGEFSTGDQKPLSDAATKRLMTIQELAALKGTKGKTSGVTLPGQDLTKGKYDKQRLRGYGGRAGTYPSQWSKARGAAGHQADEFYGVDETIRVNRAEQEKAAAETERASQLKTIRGFDSDAYAAQRRIDAEEAARVEAAIEKEKKDTAWFDIQRKITDKETAVAEKTIERETKGFGETGNIDWSNARRRELFELTKEDKAGLKEAGGDMPESGWPTPQVYAGLRGFPPQPIARERIVAINEDFENDEKDAVTQNIMNIAEQQALYNGTTSREEFVKIQALIADGKLTVVNVVDNANGTMDASPVSEDGLREQLRATDPTYIDAGPNSVVRIDGVLYEKFGDQFFPLEEMMTDEGMDIGGLPSGIPFVPTPYEHPASRQFLPDDGMGLNPARTVGSFPPINLRRRPR